MYRTEILSNNSVAQTALVSVLLVLLLSTASIRCINYGSDTAPSRQAFVTISGTGNTIMSFAGMYNGFALQDNNTAVTFNSRYPVGATMILNGGTVNLSQDLFFASEAIIGSSGIITGNSHAVEFAPNDQLISLPYLGQVNLITQQMPGAAVYGVDWTSDNQYIVAASHLIPGTLGISYAIYHFDGSSLTLCSSFTNTGVSLGNIAWQPTPSSPYYFVVETTGGIWAYEFTPPSTVTQSCFVQTVTIPWLGVGIGSVAWTPRGNQVAIGKHEAEQITVYNFNAGILSRQAGYDLVPSASVSDWGLDFDYTGSYLAVGLYGVSNTLQVFYWDGNTLTPIASANVGQTIYAVSWSPDGTRIATSVFGGAQGIQIYGFNRATNSLTLLPNYNPGQASGPRALQWSHDGRSIAATTNNILGLNNNADILFLAGNYPSANTPGAVRWSHDTHYLAVGVTGAGYLEIFNFLPVPMNLQNSNLVFNSPVQLRSSFICTGTCTINGNGYTLDLNSQIITVTSGSSLLFKNIALEGITGTNLQCIDNTGTVSFRDTTCVVNNTMQWSQGSLAIIGDCTMTGTGTFIYSSSQTSTIYHGATWYFNRGMTFSYYPQSSLNNLLNFADITAQLYLYETALHAQSTGLQFTKGTLAIEGRCPFYSDASVKANGILFGDNISSANNVNVMLLPESGIDCRSGYVVEQNIGG